MSYIRTDILHANKCVHIKLSKESHAHLRAKSFYYNISLQEIFNEFASLIVSDDKSAMRIIENLAMRKVNAALEEKPKNKKDQKISELDHDALYNLIENSKNV